MRRQKNKKYPEGVAYISTSFNNTFVSIATPNGDVICSASAGGCGFKGARKSTPYAAQLVAEKAAKASQEKVQMKTLLVVYVSGAGGGRDSAIRALKTAGLEIRCIKDITGIPHNGCRPPKKRRI